MFLSKALWKLRVDKKCKAPWCEIIVCNREESTFEDVKGKWLELVEAFKNDKQGNYKADEIMSKVYMACIQLLQNPNTYSCNIHDVETIKTTIKRVAKTDRFPQKNTIEGFQILQSTWDKIDIFNDQAVRQKMNAKRSYCLLLFLGATVTITTVCSINLSEQDWTKHTDQIIVALTLLSSIVAALVAYSNPGTKWQQLRGAALALESEVWRFRTRTGEYGANADSGATNMLRDAEIKLQKHSEVIKQVRNCVSLM